MILEHAHIDRFGTLCGRDFTFGAGLNLIYGLNESGKSTLSTFLLFLLYGLDKADREKYTNWESGTMGGYLELRHRDERYRVERQIVQGKESLRTVRLSDNTPCYKNQCPGEVFLGVGRELFVRIAYISQSEGSAVEGKGMLSAIENLLFSGDESLSTKKAQKKLQDARISLLHKNRRGGKIFDLEEECHRLEGELSRAEAEQAAIIQKEGTLSEWQDKLYQCTQELQSVSDKLQWYQAKVQSAHHADLAKHTEAERSHRAEKARIEEALQKRGPLPDYVYLEELRRLGREEEFHRLQAEHARAALDEHAKKEDNAEERARLCDLTSPYGGADGAYEAYRTAKKKAQTYTVWGWLLIILLPIALLLLTKGRKYKKEADAILNRLEIPYGSDAKEIIYARARDGEVVYEYRTALLSRRTAYKEKQEAHSRAAHALQAMLASHGEDSLTAAIAHAEDFLRQKDALNEAIRESAHQVQLCQARITKSEAEAAALLERLTQAGVQTSPEELAELERRQNYLTKQKEALMAGVHRTEVELSALHASAMAPSPIAEALMCKKTQIRSLTRRHDALVYASEAIEQAAVHLRQSLSPRLSRRAGELMSAMTQGKYQALGVSPDLLLNYTESTSDGGMQTREISSLSAGTEDLAYISLRLALADLLFGEESAPFLFDESFSRLDDNRLGAILTLLCESAERDGRQMLLFSSNTRDRTALGDRAHTQIDL